MLALGIVAVFTYFKTAYDNRNKETGRWAWNPLTWFNKGNNTNIQIGVSTNSNFSNLTVFGGIGSNNDPMASISYNSQYGVGIGGNASGFNDFYYPNHSDEAAVQKSISRFEENRSQIKMNDKYDLSGGEIRQWNKNWIDNWSENSNFLSDMSYSFFDGIYVTVQSFIVGPDSKHLTGEYVHGNERVDAFMNTTSWAVSTYAIETSSASIYGIRFETHYMSPLKGRGASGSMMVTHININKIHIIFNPSKWKYFYKWWPKEW